MARIPTLNLPQVQQAAYPGAPANLDAALAPGRGAMAIAKGISDIGQVAGEFAMRAAQAKEAATLAEQQRIQKTGLAAFETELATTPNSEDWIPLWEKHKKETQRNVNGLSKKLGTIGRARSQELYANWSTDSDIRVKTQTAVQSVRESKASLGAAAIEAWGDGDYGSGDSFIEIAEQAGVMSKTEADSYRQKGHELVDASNVNAAILANPKKAIEAIDAGQFETLTPDAKLRFKNTARVQIEHNREFKVRELDESVLGVQDGKGDPVGTEKKIREALENDEILASQARFLLKRLAGTTRPENEAAIAAALWEEADKLERGDPELRMKVSQIRQASLSLDPHLRQDIDRSLDNISKPPSASENKPSEALATLEALKSAGVLGVDDIRKPPTQIETETEGMGWLKYTPVGYLFGLGETREVPVFDAQGLPIEKLDEMGRPIIDEPRRAQQIAEYEQTQIFAAEVKRKLIAWAKEHPEATPEDHHAKLKEFIRERADVSNAMKVFNGVTGSTN